MDQPTVLLLMSTGKYYLYMKQVSRKSLTSSGSKLETLPSSSDSAKYHSFRTYHTIPQWLANDEVNPIDWGKELKSGMHLPIGTDRPVAPESILKITSCGCKVGCTRRCIRHKADLFCSAMCSACTGKTCGNIYQAEVNDDQ